jgi:uncharacterized protein Usg
LFERIQFFFAIRDVGWSNEGGDLCEMAMRDLRLQLQGYRLTTAEILYHLPDHPKILQTFLWQQLDIAPDFPVLHRFLDFWVRNIEGKLHSVKVAHAPLISPGELRHAASFELH